MISTRCGCAGCSIESAVVDRYGRAVRQNRLCTQSGGGEEDAALRSESERTPAGRAAAVVAAATGAASGLLVGGPSGLMLGAAGVQAAVEATGFVFTKLTERRRQQVAVPLVVGAAIADESVDSFAARLASDERCLPVATLVLTSAADTGLEPKLRALGAVLADAVSDDANLDLDWLIADALSVIEPPHLVVLSFLDGVAEVDLFGSGLPFERFGTGLRAIFTALESKGLLYERSELREENLGQPGRVGPAGPQRITRVRHRHVITSFGREVLRRIMEAPAGA